MHFSKYISREYVKYVKRTTGFKETKEIHSSRLIFLDYPDQRLASDLRSNVGHLGRVYRILGAINHSTITHATLALTVHPSSLSQVDHPERAG